jgi:predicted nucleic acid-binding protein
MKIILDTSAALNVVLRGEQSERLISALETANAVLCPQFMQVEMANALWKYIRWQEMPVDAALQQLEEATSLVDHWLDDANLMPQALTLAAKHDHPVYDMLYIAAALQQGARLLSLDKKLNALAKSIDKNLLPA